MAKHKNLVGLRFGRLTVSKRNGSHVHPCGNKSSLWECVCDCGVTKNILGRSLYTGVTQSCGCLNKDLLKARGGNKAWNWKNGRTKQQGYVCIRHTNHPAARRGYVFEHRLVMEKHLGRLLTDDETVHHKNGIRRDNRIANLELWSSKHPAGQRVPDLITWAKEILERYGE